MARHLELRSAPLRSDLADPQWWRLLVEKAGRQVAQVVVVLFAAQSVSPETFDVKAALLTVAAAILVTVLKAFAGIKARPGAPAMWQIIDRAWPAAAGAALGLLGADRIDLLSVNWVTTGWVAASAAIVAAASYFVTPPSS